MLKGRRTKIVVLIITGLLILSLSNILLFRIREELDKQENYTDSVNSNPIFVIITPATSITSVSDKDFDSINPEYSIFNNLNLNSYQKTTISLIVIIGTSAGIQLLCLTKNEQQKEVQESELALKTTLLDLSIEESHVLTLIEEFLNKNRVCHKPELVSFIENRNFQEDNRLNHNGIEHVIDSLAAKHIIVEGSKITKNSVLSNLNRRSIYEEIKSNPGIYLSKLSKSLGLSIFLTNWHLNILLRFDMIRKQDIYNQIAYFDSNLPSENDYIFQIISRAKCSEIIEYLKLNKKGCKKSQIIKTLRMHHTTVNKYLEILVRYQLVNLKSLDKHNFYYLNNEKFDQLKNP